MTYPMLTAAEAIAEGATPSTFFSIARFNAAAALRDNSDYNRDIAKRARVVALEIAQLLGMDIGGRRWRANNDNKRGYGKPRSKRKAA